MHSCESSAVFGAQGTRAFVQVRLDKGNTLVPSDTVAPSTNSGIIQIYGL